MVCKIIKPYSHLTCFSSNFHINFTWIYLSKINYMSII